MLGNEECQWKTPFEVQLKINQDIKTNKYTYMYESISHHTHRYLPHVSVTCGGKLCAFVVLNIISSCPMHGHGSFKIDVKCFPILYSHLLYPSYTFRAFMSPSTFFLKANTATVHVLFRRYSFENIAAIYSKYLEATCVNGSGV